MLAGINTEVREEIKNDPQSLSTSGDSEDLLIQKQQQWFSYEDSFKLNDETTLTSVDVIRMLAPFLVDGRKRRIEEVVAFLFHSKDAAVFRPWQSSDVLFGALVDASGRAELYGITDQSINLDLGLYEPISIPEASTPNLLIVQDPFMSLLRAPIASVWKVDVDSFKFL